MAHEGVPLIGIYENFGWRGREVEEAVVFQTGGVALVLWGRARRGRGTRSRDRAPLGGAGGLGEVAGLLLGRARRLAVVRRLDRDLRQ